MWSFQVFIFHIFCSLSSELDVEACICLVMSLEPKEDFEKWGKVSVTLSLLFAYDNGKLIEEEAFTYTFY